MPHIDGPKMTFVADSGGLAPYRLCKASGGIASYNTATATDDPLGATETRVAGDENVTLKMLNAPGTLEVEAAGAITQDADVYAAADGKIMALPSAAGTYRKIGKALDAASAAGAVIEILPYGYTETTTVTE